MPLWKDQIKEALSKTITNLPGDISEALTRILGEVRLPSAERRKDIRTALRSTTAVLIEGPNKAQADFERALPEGYVPILRQIAETNRFPDQCDVGAKRDLLLNSWRPRVLSSLSGVSSCRIQRRCLTPPKVGQFMRSTLRATRWRD